MFKEGASQKRNQYTGRTYFFTVFFIRCENMLKVESNLAKATYLRNKDLTYVNFAMFSTQLDTSIPKKQVLITLIIQS